MRDKFATLPIALLLAAILVALICHVITNSNTVEARYLPTRSDKSEIETLKEIIRGLLIESAGAPPSRQEPLYQNQLARGGYMQRRAAEMSVGSSNGGEESEGYLASPFESTGSHLALKPMSQRPDR